jgi:putative membrane protein
MTLLFLFKAFHIIAFVAWFGGLFYLVRMFVYHRESFDKPEPARSILVAQFELMEDRVYRIICNPGMMLTWLFGLGMLYIYGLEWLKVSYWMHVKLLLLFGLTYYHLYCKKIIKQLKENTAQLTSFQYRLMNEVPTLFLVAIVIIAVYHNLAHFGYVFGGVLLFGVALYFFARLYKKMRKD